MHNLFDPATAADIFLRIEKLQPDCKALWGKMNGAQMLSHVQAPIEVALGDKQLKRTLIGFLFGRIARKKLFNAKPYPVNLPTDTTFVRKGDHHFDTEKQKLIMMLNRFVSGGYEGLSQLPHPFFGKLTPAEWSIGMYKHIDHHFKQFGA